MTKLDFAAIANKLNAYQYLYVAYSGGGDSHVLLHGLMQQADCRDRVIAVYINHNLSEQDRRIQYCCAEICSQWGVTYRNITVDAQAKAGQSPEDAARRARYQALFALLGPKDILLTVHHQDDQAETLLLQLFRGTGLAGLAAMPATSGALHRPLLAYTRADLRAYANAHDLQWQEDGSNYNMNYGRNFLRHRILPVVQERWPSLSQTLSRTAQHCAQAHALLQEYTRGDYEAIYDPTRHTLSIPKLLQLSDERQRQVLRYWLVDLHLPVPNASVMNILQTQVLHAKRDACPRLRWSDIDVRRFQHQLYAMRLLAELPKDLEVSWDMAAPLQLPHGLGKLEVVTTQSGGMRIGSHPHVHVRLRRGGERFRLQGDAHHRTLKYYFQKWKIPHWQRQRIPLVFMKEELVCMVGYGVSEAYAAPLGEPSQSIKCVSAA